MKSNASMLACVAITMVALAGCTKSIPEYEVGGVRVVGTSAAAQALKESLARRLARDDRHDNVVEVSYAPPASYPRDLLWKGIQGEVVIGFTIMEDGRALELEVLSSPHPGLSAAAMQAVYQWRFTPPTRQGKPVKLRLVYPVEFRIIE